MMRAMTAIFSVVSMFPLRDSGLSYTMTACQLAVRTSCLARFHGVVRRGNAWMFIKDTPQARLLGCGITPIESCELLVNRML